MNSRYSSDLGLSVNDRNALSIMSDSKRLITDSDGPHYEISIPFKSYPPPLLDNRQQCRRRLLALTICFKRDPAYFGMHLTQIQDALGASRFPLIDVPGRNYIPHHGVTSPKKPGEIRIVFNCASEYHSLNDCIYSGPDLTNRLVPILVRFREGKIALCADVEAMYHRVRASPRDYTYLRFLFFPDGNLKCEPKDYYMCVHLFGSISSSACANYT